MGALSWVRRLAAGLAVAGLLGGCAQAATLSPAATPIQTVANVSPQPATTTPNGSAVSVTADVPYQSSDPLLDSGVLDVYAPATPGPWPVVIMFHGDPAGSTTKVDLAVHARKVAQSRFVVFVPSWGQFPAGSSLDWTKAVIEDSSAQVACAVAFAASQAVRFGGDPARLIVFGHSAGAMAAAGTVFGRPDPSPGCLGGSTLPSISALVTWEGDWLLAWDPGWDDRLAADPSVLDAATSWSSLAHDRTVRVAMLVADDPEMPDLPVDKLAARDPSGALRKQLEANGALADGQISDTESQQLLFSLLKAQGNPVTLDVMPDSTHGHILGEAGWPVFLAAFAKASASS